MMKINILIPRKVKGKQRPKFNRYSGKVYTPQQTINYENWVKTCFLEQCGEIKPLEKPLKVIINSYYEMPKSVSKKKKMQMLRNEIVPTVKPDLDNIAKSILDSLNGLAYLDDKQVVYLEVAKFYSDNAYVLVSIEEIEEVEII